MVNDWLRKKLADGFITIDIGSSYGVFQYLLHLEYPGCHQVLVDLPEHLLFARYFLASCFPGARIAGVKELERVDSVSVDFIRNYDFVLLPADWYKRMQPGTVDLLTSFACLGELTREYFDYYIQHPVFSTARYWYTANPIAPTEGSVHSGATDISILDYPVWDKSKMICFGVSPVFVRSYGYKIDPFPSFFEYIGKN
jgi:hypothetical protein